jgi:hypothetical protein
MHLVCLNLRKRFASKLISKILHMTYYIYKRNRAGASFQLGWSFTKKDLATKLDKYAFWKQNGYEVFFIERS